MENKQITKLSNKRENFCQIYCNNGYIAYKAYMKAYPNVKEETARVNSSKLLTITNIKARIKEIQAEKAEKQELNIRQHEIEVMKDREAARDARSHSAVATFDDQLGKHLGFYEADNEQKREEKELTSKQKADLEEFMAWKRGKLIKYPAKAG